MPAANPQHAWRRSVQARLNEMAIRHERRLDRLARFAEARLNHVVPTRPARGDERDHAVLIAGVILGLSAILALVYALFKRSTPVNGVGSTTTTPAPTTPTMMMPVMMMPMQMAPATAVPAPVVSELPTPESPPMQPRPRYGTSIRTITLPTITGQAVRVANATDVAYKVTVRTVSPPGAFAVLSFDASELNTPNLAAIPNGNTLLLPAGQDDEIRLMPRQVLYAKGNVVGVVLSVVASELLEA